MKKTIFTLFVFLSIISISCSFESNTTDLTINLPTQLIENFSRDTTEITETDEILLYVSVNIEQYGRKTVTEVFTPKIIYNENHPEGYIEPINIDNLDKGSYNITIYIADSEDSLKSKEYSYYGKTKQPVFVKSGRTTQADIIIEEIIVEGGEYPEPQICTILFMNGDQLVAEFSGLPGETFEIPDAPKKTGYEFKEWNPEVDTTITESVTYNAVWTPINYTITYVLDDGTNAENNPTSYTIESDTITFTEPTKEGFTFVAWVDSDGITITQIQQGSTGDITITATWKENVVDEDDGVDNFLYTCNNNGTVSIGNSDSGYWHFSNSSGTPVGIAVITTGDNKGIYDYGNSVFIARTYTEDSETTLDEDIKTEISYILTTYESAKNAATTVYMDSTTTTSPENIIYPDLNELVSYFSSISGVWNLVYDYYAGHEKSDAPEYTFDPSWCFPVIRPAENIEITLPDSIQRQYRLINNSTEPYNDISKKSTDYVIWSSNNEDLAWVAEGEDLTCTYEDAPDAEQLEGYVITNSYGEITETTDVIITAHFDGDKDGIQDSGETIKQITITINPAEE